MDTKRLLIVAVTLLGVIAASASFVALKFYRTTPVIILEPSSANEISDLKAKEAEINIKLFEGEKTLTTTEQTELKREREKIRQRRAKLEASR